MKKQLLLLVLFMGIFSAMNAQDKKMMLGVDLGFSSNDAHSSFNLGPSFGYWLNENSAIVVGINFGSATLKGATDLKNSSFSGGAEFRYGWSMGDMAFLYIAPGIEFGSVDNEFDEDGPNAYKGTTLDIRAALGATYKIADAWSLDARFGRIGYASETPDGGEAFGTFGLDLSMSTLSFGLWYHF